MIQKIKNSLKKRKVKIFLVFLFCSASAWFISNLSESYLGHTTFDLDYSNERDDLLLINASQDKIDARLEAVGFQFLAFKFKMKKVSIDVSSVAKDAGQYYLPHQNLQAQIEKQLPNSMRLIDMDTDTLFFDFQEVISKEVPVDPQLTLKLAKNYLLYGKLEITPPSIVVKGPRNEVDTIVNVKSSKLELTDLTTDFSHTVNIAVPPGLQYTSFSESSVSVAGKVSKFSEKMISVAIKATNLPPGTSIKMFPDAVDVLCKGTINDLKRLVTTDFEVLADFGEIGKNQGNRVRLKLAKRPEQLSSVTLQTTDVEYILKRER